MDRRAFLRKATLAAALVGVTVTVSSCGDDDPAGPSDGAGGVTGTATGGGHTHTGVITQAQLVAGAAVTITFSGSGHTHGLPLSDTEVMTIAQGTRVEKNFTDSHPHTYTFN